MSNVELIDALLDAGLVQFGAFEHKDAMVPYWLRLDMLPSYPVALRLAAEAVAALVAPANPDRLISLHDAQPLSTLVSQILNIPLVIHNGTLGQSARNFAGAYDIGHVTALIGLMPAAPDGFIARLLGDAASVGLDIMLFATLISGAPQNEIRHVAALSLRDVADRMVEQGELSAAMAARVSGG